MQRIFSTLLKKGRSSLAQIAHHAALNPTQVRHGIAVLFQHSLVYWHVDFWTEVTMYDANVDRAYNLVRTGKILEMVETSMGAPARDVVQSLFLLGQTRLGDLMGAYQGQIEKANNAIGTNGDAKDANGA